MLQCDWGRWNNSSASSVSGWGRPRRSFYRPKLHCGAWWCAASPPSSLALSRFFFFFFFFFNVHCSQPFCNEAVAPSASPSPSSARLPALGDGGGQEEKPGSPLGSLETPGSHPWQAGLAGSQPEPPPPPPPSCPGECVRLEWKPEPAVCYGNAVCCYCSIAVTNMPLKWKTSSPASWKFPVAVLKTSRSSPLSPAYM